VKNLVSIIIPTLNSEKTINRTINSVLKQDYKNWEIIIIDSFSNDKTIRYIKSFGLKKIKIFSHPKSKGLASARYYGIKKAKGSLIAFLDSDDEWNKKKLNYQSKFHNSSKKKFTSLLVSFNNPNGATAPGFNPKYSSKYDSLAKDSFLLLRGSDIALRSAVISSIKLTK